jgi:hypothetical protein
VQDAAKSDMVRRRIDRLRMACGGPIASATVGSAWTRAALDDLARNFDLGLIEVIRLL